MHRFQRFNAISESAHSKKTRIETRAIENAGADAMDCESAHSKKTRIETSRNIVFQKYLISRESAHSKKTRIETHKQVPNCCRQPHVKAPIPRKQGLKQSMTAAIECRNDR